jgi:hypothetical protein
MTTPIQKILKQFDENYLGRLDALEILAQNHGMPPVTEPSIQDFLRQALREVVEEVEKWNKVIKNVDLSNINFPSHLTDQGENIGWNTHAKKLATFLQGLKKSL